jgi:hypothetical protein
MPKNTAKPDNHKNKTLRDALVPMLLSGEIRLHGVVGKEDGRA